MTPLQTYPAGHPEAVRVVRGYAADEQRRRIATEYARAQLLLSEVPRTRRERKSIERTLRTSYGRAEL